MPFDQTTYNLDYQREHIIRKTVKFNNKNQDDNTLLEWLSSRQNFSGYCKELIRADMEKETEDQK